MSLALGLDAPGALSRVKLAVGVYLALEPGVQAAAARSLVCAHRSCAAMRPRRLASAVGREGAEPPLTLSSLPQRRRWRRPG
jgi:hypothetical protein